MVRGKEYTDMVYIILFIVKSRGVEVAQREQGPRFFVDLEGVEYPWDRETISVPEIRNLAGWDASQPVVEVDLQANIETQLADDAVVELKPGHGFAKKVKFQRG